MNVSVQNWTNADGRYNGVCVMDGEIYFEGRRLPPLPNRSVPVKVVAKDGRLIINNYEWKEGRWIKRTNLFQKIFFK